MLILKLLGETVKKFYHRTTEKNWKKIKDEGILFGITENAGYRYTYLSPHDMGDSYGDILLEVEYEPKGNPSDNYGFNPPIGQECWQFSVFIPISIDFVKEVTRSQKEEKNGQNEIT